MNLKEVLDNIMNEQDTQDIKVKHSGILDIPENKNFWDMPIKHFNDLMSKKGRAAIMRALTNLERWNKNKNPEISKKARKIIDAVKEKE
jgi:hypothetical protein